MSCSCMDYNNQTEKDNKEGGYHYHVQIGVFRDYNLAMSIQLELFELGWVTDIERQGDLYSVCMGDFTEVDRAAMLELYLRFNGYNTLVIAV